MIFKYGKHEVEVYYLLPRHFDLLNSVGLELSQLPYLPQFKEVTDSDCLDWLAFQRSVEKQLCGFKSTTYEFPGNITIGDINRKGVVYKTKYDEVLNADSSVKLGQQFYFHMFNGKLFILNSDNTVNSNTFKNVQGNLASSLYQALLTSLNIFELYFNSNVELTEPVGQRKYIDLGYLISKSIS